MGPLQTHHGAHVHPLFLLLPLSLQKKRGQVRRLAIHQIEGPETREGRQTFKAMLPRAELFAIGGKYAPFSDDVLRDNSGQMLVDIKAQAGLGVSASLCKTTGGGIAALAGLCSKAKLHPIVVHD